MGQTDQGENVLGVLRVYAGGGPGTGGHHLVWEARIEHNGNDSWTWWVCVGDHTVEGSVTGAAEEMAGFVLSQGMVSVVVAHILKGHG